MSKLNRVICGLLVAAVCASSGLAAETAPAALIEAIRSNNLQAIKQMIARGVDVNQAADRGTTPLMYAAGFGSLEAMRMLLQAGANVNAKNAFDATALMWSVQNLAKVKLLVEKGADVNAKSKPGRTPLLLAAMQDGSLEVVRLLLAKGADLKVTDSQGFSVVLAAAASNNLAVLRLAVEAGADLSAKGNVLSFTPLGEAASNGNVEAVKLLLAKGADPNTAAQPASFKVKNGLIRLGSFTPVMLASAAGPPELVKMLLVAGAKVNAKDDRGMTALHYAVSSEAQDPEIVRILLDAGADPLAKMETGETAQDWAAKFGKPGTLALLKVKPAERNALVLTGATSPAKPAEVRAAAQKSLALMEKTSAAFMSTGGCSSCHAQDITSMAAAVAKAHGLEVDNAAASARLAIVKGQWGSATDAMILRLDPPGGYDTIDYSLFGMHAAGYKPDAATDALVRNVAVQQQHDGRWHAGGITRAPIHDSDFTRTAMSLRVLQMFGPEGCKAEFTERVDRARKWLLSATPKWTEERDMQLLGLKWSGADGSEIGKRAAELIAEQRPDGGWAQNAYLASDAYATAQALYALHQAGGVAAADPVYQRGVAFLIRTQHDDGSWHVQSRAPKFQPYFQSGFPYDHDQWISMMATGWATMALSFAVQPDAQVALK